MVQRSPGVLWRRELDGVLMLSLSSDDPVHVSAPGDAVWELLREPLDTDVLVAHLAKRFQADPNTVETDVVGLLRTLREHSLIVDV